MRRASFVVLFAGAFALALVTTTRDAKADSTTADWWTTFQLDTRLLAPTALDVDGAQFGSRNVTARLPKDGSTTLVGASWSFGVTLAHHYSLPIFGFGGAFAVGAYPEQTTSLDGSIVHQRPWNTTVADITIGGFGYRTNERRWAFSATILPGITWISSSADAAFGNSTYELDPGRTLFFARAELSACRRLDPIERVCLVVAPNLYQDGFFQGGTIGLRYEVGK